MAQTTRTRRRWRRLRGGDERDYREARKELKRRIREAKAKCWAELVKSVDDDPLGKPYKVVMKKLRGPPATAKMEHQSVRDIAAVLFLRGNRDGVTTELVKEEGPADITEFTKEEVTAGVGRFRSRDKAPGPDGIPSRV